MSPTTMERPPELDSDMLRVLLDSVEDELAPISNRFAVLARNPSDPVAAPALMRSLHTMAGNCRMCFLDPLADFLQSIRDCLADVRAARLEFTSLLSETLLLGLDQIKIRIDALSRRGECDIGVLNTMASLFHDLHDAGAQELPKLLGQIIELAGGHAVADLPFDGVVAGGAELSAGLELGERNGDLHFFRSMGALVDGKCQYWSRRTDTQLQLALGINRHLSTAEDPHQLAAAVCLHDLGMAFLPEGLIEKTRRLDALEEKRLQQHVQWSYDWLRRMSGWNAAAGMVMQHHERPDGSGYPAGLRGQQISSGAQIIAVVDALHSMTNERPDRPYKRSLLRAITEINACAGAQFDPAVVTALNALMRSVHTKQNGDRLQVG